MEKFLFKHLAFAGKPRWFSFTWQEGKECSCECLLCELSITGWRTYRIRYSSLHFTTHMALAGTYARNMHVALTWPPGARGIGQRYDLRVWSTFARYWQLLTSGYSSVSLPTNPQNYSCFWWQNLKCLWSMGNRDTAWRQLDQHDTWTLFFLRVELRHFTAREPTRDIPPLFGNVDYLLASPSTR